MEDRTEAIIRLRNEHAAFFKKEFLDRYYKGEDCDARLARLSVLELRDQLDRVLYELRLLNMKTGDNQPAGLLFKGAVVGLLAYIAFKL